MGLGVADGVGATVGVGSGVRVGVGVGATVGVGVGSGVGAFSWVGISVTRGGGLPGAAQALKSRAKMHSGEKNFCT